jgi:S1-C subfamily serine protease
VRNDWTWGPATLLDSVAGAAFYVVALSIVVWVFASALALLPESPVSSAVNSSKVIASIDTVITTPARRASAGLQGVLDASGFPRVFDSIVEPTALPVAAPNDSLLADPSLRRASASLVKVSGLASDCSEQITGSGFVFAPERVMTNAHVVAGVEDPTVQVDGVGRMLSASVVYFDPAIDVAVLAVPDLTAVPLRFGGVAGRGSDAVVAGFPGGGKLTAEAARVRGRITAQGQDIHGTGPVTRDIYSVRSRVLPGNSGGPLLSPTGLVYGVVFAAASRDPSTGYALTADEVAAAAAAGRKATQAVPTGSCIAG